MASGFLIGFITAGGSPLASSADRPVRITITGIQPQVSSATRGLGREAGGSLGWRPTSNPVVPGTMPESQSTANGGFLVPFTVASDAMIAEYALQTRLRFRIARDVVRSRAITTTVDEYESTVMVFPNVEGLDDFAQRITGNFDTFGTVVGHWGEQIDDALREPVIDMVTTAWTRGRMIVDPEQRIVMLSVVRIGFPTDIALSSRRSIRA